MEGRTVDRGWAPVERNLLGINIADVEFVWHNK